MQPQWTTDILGPDFQQLTLPLSADPDREGPVFATLVRYCPADKDPTALAGRPAILWVHGMTDYFFHDHVAKHFHDLGYAFYGVDLRKCGRSHREGQHWHYVSDLALYDEDLNRAVDTLIGAEHSEIFPLAHSTGGLIVPLWLSGLRQQAEFSGPESLAAKRFAGVAGAMFNSPWLDMMFPQAAVTAIRPVARRLARARPFAPLPQDGLGAYGRSIHKSADGEWDFDLTMKPIAGHKKYWGWLDAILRGQRKIHRGEVDCGVPVLVMCSTRSALTNSSRKLIDQADGVLDVEQIQRWAPKLATDVSVKPLANARHDIFLSSEPTRAVVFKTMEQWLERQLDQPVEQNEN